MVNRFGIMQGRLLPAIEQRIQCFPRARWADEFALAAQAQLACIEWIYDLYGADVNPLATEVGIARMQALMFQHRVEILSVCADYFMDLPLVRIDAYGLDERLATLSWLLERCRLLNVQRLVLPFVDASRIETDDEFEQVVQTLARVLPVAERTRVEVHVESSLPPLRLAALLDRLPHPLLKVNYDSGNSASLGYRPRQEFEAYGARIGSVHLKDRVYGGGTVPLGTGAVAWRELFDGLRTRAYQGDMILQVARGVAGDEVAWAQQNCAFVRQQMR